MLSLICAGHAEPCSPYQAIGTAWNLFENVITASGQRADEDVPVYSFEVGVYEISHPLLGRVWDVQIWEDAVSDRKHFEALIGVNSGEVLLADGTGDYRDLNIDQNWKQSLLSAYESQWGDSGLWDYTQWHTFGVSEGFSGYILPTQGIIPCEEAEQTACEVFRQETGMDSDTAEIGSQLQVDVFGAEWTILIHAADESQSSSAFCVCIDALTGKVKLFY